MKTYTTIVKDSDGNFKRCSKPPSFTMISKRLAQGKDKAFENQALASSLGPIELLAEDCAIQVGHSVVEYKVEVYE